MDSDEVESIVRIPLRPGGLGRYVLVGRSWLDLHLGPALRSASDEYLAAVKAALAVSASAGVRALQAADAHAHAEPREPTDELVADVLAVVAERMATAYHNTAPSLKAAFTSAGDAPLLLAAMESIGL